MTTPELEQVRNFRDLGGAPTADGRRVRTGRIFRSGHLASATDADLQTLARLGIHVVIDFRGPTDIAHEGEDRLPPGVERISLPMFDAATSDDIRTLFAAGDPEAIRERYGDGKAFEVMKQGAAHLVSHAERSQQFGQMVRRLAQPDGTPALIHCSAGKDRTGWAASLMLLTLGVDEGDVIAHYLESNARSPYRLTAASVRDAGLDPDILMAFISVHEEYARASLAALDETWGGLDGYLRKGLGVDDDVIDAFRDAMLEPA